MNATETREYWKGYRYMKRLSLELWSANKAIQSINDSNASNAFYKGAQRAYRYIKSVGLQYIRA